MMSVQMRDHEERSETVDLLEAAVQTITERYLLPYQLKIKTVCERAESIYLTLDTEVLARLYYRQLDILATERAIKVLQRIDFWESLHKGILRYICQHPFNKDTFNEMIDVIGTKILLTLTSIEITFDEKKIETIVELVEEDSTLVFAISVSSLSVDSWSPDLFYNTISEILEEYEDRVRTRRQNDDLNKVALTQVATNVSFVQTDEPQLQNGIEELKIEESGKLVEDLKLLAMSRSVLDGDLSKIVRLVHQPGFWQPVCFEQCSLTRIDNSTIGNIRTKQNHH
jgi:hypothetical protein